MEHDFWHQRWHEGRTGFHLSYVNPLLVKHWDCLSTQAPAKVFVPLCGRSQDMVWLEAQGYNVLGVEISPVACEQFFADQQRLPERSKLACFERLATGAVELWCGDVFALGADDLSTVNAVYDRAAFIALPAEMRKGYAKMLCERLPIGVQMLLVTLEKEGAAIDAGPPFSVVQSEVELLFGGRFNVSLLSEQCADRPGSVEKVYRLVDRL